MHVLLVEDDDRVARALRSALLRHGYEVTHAGNAGAAMAGAAPDSPSFAKPSLILLDLGLPDLDGVEVCRRLRTKSNVPIIVVTARGDEGARVVGLRAGADDYVVKPFGIAELLARMEAVLRRSGATAPFTAIDAADVHIDLARRTVSVAGQEVILTRKEFDLLAALARHRGAVVGRRDLLTIVWGTTWTGSSRTLDVHVATLRAKLGRPALIQTVRGVGYRLVVDPRPAR
jgi:DNA-binding response OmpR family regulator